MKMKDFHKSFESGEDGVFTALGSAECIAKRLPSGGRGEWAVWPPAAGNED